MGVVPMSSGGTGFLAGRAGGDGDTVEGRIQPLRGSPSRSAARYEASFFGPFFITRDGRPLEESAWRRNTALMLLKWFLLNPAERFSTQELCAMFWPTSTLKSAANSLHVTLHHLRHALEPELPPGCPSTFIRHDKRKYYRFDLRDLWWTDVLEVQALSAAARDADSNGPTAVAIALYNQLVAYYRRTFLPEDVYEDFFSPYRHQHELAYAQALKHLMRLYLRDGSFSAALSCALHVLDTDPYNEDAVRTIVQVYLRQGYVTGAVTQLDDFLQVLKHDLDLEPSNELLALRDTILVALRRHAQLLRRAEGKPVEQEQAFNDLAVLNGEVLGGCRAIGRRCMRVIK